MKDHHVCDVFEYIFAVYKRSLCPTPYTNIGQTLELHFNIIYYIVAAIVGFNLIMLFQVS